MCLLVCVCLHVVVLFVCCCLFVCLLLLFCCCCFVVVVVLFVVVVDVVLLLLLLFVCLVWFRGDLHVYHYPLLSEFLYVHMLMPSIH